MDKLTKFRAIAVAVSLAVIFALVGVFSVFPTPQPASADSVGAARNITLYSGVAATSTSTTTVGVLTVYYGEADCYSIVSGMAAITATGATTVTNKIQHSPDNSNWVDLTSWATANVTNSVLFTHTSLPGQYIRLSQTVAPDFPGGPASKPITSSVVCSIKNVVR